MRRCLLDMDGVLVDFVGGVCRLRGIDNPYNDPIHHGQPDLDKVLGIAKSDLFEPLGENFWAELQPTAECFHIVEKVETMFGRDKVCILSSPILTPGCHEGKIRWLRKHLPQFARRNLIGACKEFAASPDSWLIDDSDRNVALFEGWGGNTVLVPRPWNVLHDYHHEVFSSISKQLRMA